MNTSSSPTLHYKHIIATGVVCSFAFPEEKTLELFLKYANVLYKMGERRKKKYLTVIHSKSLRASLP